MQPKTSLLSFCALALALSACSAKLNGGDIPSMPAKPFTDSVKGPALDGQYQSDCVADRWSNNEGYVKFNMTIRGRNVTRQESTFADAQCTQAGPEKTSTGQFRYVSQPSTTVYEVEYQFSMNGGSYTTGENIRFANGVLYISDRVTGDDVDPDIALQPQPSK